MTAGVEPVHAAHHSQDAPSVPPAAAPATDLSAARADTATQAAPASNSAAPLQTLAAAPQILQDPVSGQMTEHQVATLQEIAGPPAPHLDTLAEAAVETESDEVPEAPLLRTTLLLRATHHSNRSAYYIQRLLEAHYAPNMPTPAPTEAGLASAAHAAGQGGVAAAHAAGQGSATEHTTSTQLIVQEFQRWRAWRTTHH